MRGLFNSIVKAEQNKITQVDGIRQLGWVAAGETDDEKALLSYISCRIDFNFIRQGKDAPVAIQAGQAPERAGIFFCGPEYLGVLRAGMRLTAIPNAIGDIPVPGVFEIRAIPDAAVDYSTRHHLEVQVFETVQRDLAKAWPDAEGGYEVES